MVGNTAPSLWDLSQAGWWALGYLSVSCLAIRLINVNRFSLHTIYRDGLTRTFLAASRPGLRNKKMSPPKMASAEELRQFQNRSPDPMVNLDNDDAPRFDWLAPRRKQLPDGGLAFPLLILNGCLNAQGDRAQIGPSETTHPFTFSSLHCGSPIVGYAPTELFPNAEKGEGLRISTAMAVSGAAVSPQAGVQNHSIISFVLMAINARLGAWFANPKFPAMWSTAAPSIPILQFLSEFGGRRTLKEKWLHISDGGHFDNLGIYELMRRGMDTTIAVDATADQNFEFVDLAATIRRCQQDLGIKFELEGAWRIGAKDVSLGSLCASFRVKHPQRYGPGHLLYIKPALYSVDLKVPVPIRSYASQSASFPHESTINQFYSAAQLEAYRNLGQHVIDSIEVSSNLDGPTRTVDDFIERANEIARETGEDSWESLRDTALKEFLNALRGVLSDTE
jgi:hypothetical protein